MRSAERIPWRLLAAGLAFVLLAVVAAMAVQSYTAHLRIEAVGAEALADHGGDQVEALIAFLESDRHSLTDKNLAIWKLGQLDDARAVPVLESLRTGQPCDHARFVCQREVEKALSRLSRSEAQEEGPASAGPDLGGLKPAPPTTGQRPLFPR